MILLQIQQKDLLIQNLKCLEGFTLFAVVLYVSNLFCWMNINPLLQTFFCNKFSLLVQLLFFFVSVIDFGYGHLEAWMK